MTSVAARQPDTGRIRVGRTYPVVLWATGLCCVLLVATGFGLGLYPPNLHNGLIAASFTAVGLFVVSKRRGNREGWLFVATGLAHAVIFVARQYGFYAGGNPIRELPAVAWVTWLGVWPLIPVLVLVGVTMMCFPDGRLPSARWRGIVVGMVAVGVPMALVSALWPVEYAENGLSVPHPLRLGGYEPVRAVWNVASPVGYLGIQLVWVTCVVARLRRARGDEARQLRWFAYAVVVTAVAIVTGLVAFGSPTPGVLTVPLVPLVITVALAALVRDPGIAGVPRARKATLVTAAASALATVGALLHVVAATDADRIGHHDSMPPLSGTYFVLETISVPIFAFGVAALAVIGALSRTLGNRFTAAFGVIGGVGYGLAGGTAIVTPVFDFLFPTAIGVGLWTVAAGIGLLLRHRVATPPITR